MNISTIYAPKLLLDRDALIKQNGIRPGSSDYARFCWLADEAEEKARPLALVSKGRLTENPGGVILIDSTSFRLEEIRRFVSIPASVFPFIATCGTELYDLSMNIHDISESLWLQAIMEKALDEAVRAATGFGHDGSGHDNLSIISPGSFPGWDIREQENLFGLFQSHTEHVGIYLNSGMMLIPEHSLTGILVPCREKHDLCSLCSSKKCPRRKASPLK